LLSLLIAVQQQLLLLSLMIEVIYSRAIHSTTTADSWRQHLTPTAVVEGFRWLRGLWALTRLC